MHSIVEGELNLTLGIWQVFMAITDDHWTVFRLTEQEGYSFHQASEKMGITRQGVLKLLTELKSIEPSLFPIESERGNIRRQLRDVPIEVQPDMLSYSSDMDDGHIKSKF